MNGKRTIKLGSSTPVVNLYPSDLHDIVALDATLVLKTTWGPDIVGEVVPIYKEGTKEITSYELTLSRGETTAKETVDAMGAIAIYAGTTFSMRKLYPPKGLRNKISFALCMNREKRAKTVEELHEVYKEQINLHDEAILSDIAVSEKAYMPVRFDFGNFHIIALSDGYGQFNISDGYFFMDGFLTADEALDILENVPPKYVDIRRIEWIKQVIEANPEDDTPHYNKRPYYKRKDE